jgi:hypothetical protein
MDLEMKKTVRYSPDTIFNKMKKKSTTSFDKYGKIIRPVIVNNIHYIRHDKLKHIL